jgi:hypothetical protein
MTRFLHKVFWENEIWTFFLSIFNFPKILSPKIHVFLVYVEQKNKFGK